MKITYIVPGFGGIFYCGNCLRDKAFAKSLKDLGHDSITLPLYLPHSIEEFVHQSDVPVFYGVVNIFLKQNYKVFRKMPKWLYNFFNSEYILKYAAKKSGSTRAEGLEEMTISMLKGADGFQNEELSFLIDFLKHHEKPDVVHLSNALLIGLAAKIKQELNIPVFCSLQDEDVWINAMAENYKPVLWKLMSEKANDVDGFIAVSDYFANLMKKNMNIPDNKISVVHLGVDPNAYKIQKPKTENHAIGYLSRINKENGFEILVDAFIKLKKNSVFKNLKLIVTGGKTNDDKSFINKQLFKLRKENLIDFVEFIDDFRTSELTHFFEKLTVLSVPVLDGEAFGLYLLESLASGIPVVQPSVGAFPEIIEKTGGGVNYSPNNSTAFAEKLAEILINTEKLFQMSTDGRKAIEEKFNINLLAEKWIEFYKIYK